MSKKEQLLTKALRLPPAEKAEIIDQLIRSLDKPDPEIDQLWANEVEDRIEAFEKGNIQAFSLQEVIEKYKKE